MRVTKILVSAVAVGVAFIGLTMTTESRAGDEELVSLSCSGGAITAHGKGGFHVNKAAPWKWDKGDLVKQDPDDAHKVLFKGAKCEGTVKAYVCKEDGSQCKGPIPIPVK